MNHQILRDAYDFELLAYRDDIIRRAALREGCGRDEAERRCAGQLAAIDRELESRRVEAVGV